MPTTPWESATQVPLTEGVSQGQAVTWLCSRRSGRWADPAEPHRALPPSEGSAKQLATATHQPQHRKQGGKNGVGQGRGGEKGPTQ